jgi:insertion element IS1 protein InsB
MQWLLEFIAETYNNLPDHLNVRLVENGKDVIIQTLESEVDELWSFVGSKDNKQWVWIAMDVSTRQIIAFHVGDRSQKSAKKLWQKIPKIYHDQATFYTDQHAAYEGVIPAKQHRAVTKQSGKVNHLERFNCTLRQRVSRLVRKALSFSKKLTNHIGAIKYFICHYNLAKA